MRMSARAAAAVRVAGAWLLGLGLGCAALAHEFKLDALISAFVSTSPGELQLVVRAPLYLFKSVRFPVAGAEIDVDASGPAVERALAAIEKDIQLFEDGRPLAASAARGRLSLPSDRSFQDLDTALAHVATPIEPGTHIFIDQGYVDAQIRYPIVSPASEFSLRSTAGPELGDALKLSVRYLPAQGGERALVFGNRSGVVALNPTRLRAAAGFTRMGVAHILGGADHLLFLLCLLIPLRGWRPMLSVVTVFTVAHSFTLLGSALGLAPAGRWFPPFVEAAIAASIVFMALENIIGVRIERRLLVTGLFGMVHGFGFSYGLQQSLQYAGTHLVVSLFAFNVGIELGQLLALSLMLPALALLRRHLLPGRVGMVILSAIVAETGWRWMLDRAETLWATPWPAPSLGGLATAALWIGGIVLAGAALAAVAQRWGLAEAPARPRPMPSVEP